MDACAYMGQNTKKSVKNYEIQYTIYVEISIFNNSL
jgi:hypothetical protein